MVEKKIGKDGIVEIENSPKKRKIFKSRQVKEKSSVKKPNIIKRIGGSAKNRIKNSLQDAYSGSLLDDAVSSVKNGAKLAKQNVKKGIQGIKNGALKPKNIKNRIKNGIKNSKLGKAAAGIKSGANKLKKGFKKYNPAKPINSLRRNGLKGSLKNAGSGIKSKALERAKTRLGKLKDTGVGLKNWASKKIKRFFNKIKKFAKTLWKFKIPILILVVFPLTAILAITPMIMGIVGGFGSTPHYYCQITADDAVKDTEIYKRYCYWGTKSGGNETIAQAALSLAYDPSDLTSTSNSLNPSGKIWTDTFKAVYTSDHFFGSGNDVSGYHGADCGVAASLAIRWCGADPDFPPNGTSIQNNYCSKDEHDRWETIGDGTTPVAEEDLQPGDVFIVNQGSGVGAAGHIGIYVGHEMVEEMFPGKGSMYNTVEASLSTVTSRLDTWTPTDSRGIYCVYRCVNDNPEPVDIEGFM